MLVLALLGITVVSLLGLALIANPTLEETDMDMLPDDGFRELLEGAGHTCNHRRTVRS